MLVVPEPIVLCVECRFSDPEAKTVLSKLDVKRKRDETVRQFRPYFRTGIKSLATSIFTYIDMNTGACFNGFTIKEENLYLVICAFREMNNNVCEDIPSNTIVLDRVQLEALYTPSLATHPQFILLG